MAGSLALVLAAPVAGAQLPGLPVLQNGFVRPGWAIAANVGSSDDALALAAAGAWTPGSARFQVNAAAGVLQPEGDGDSQSAAGLRVAVPIGTPWTGQPTSALGLAVFAGAGYARQEDIGTVQIPVGVGLGYRRRLGATRAVSAFLTPYYALARRTGDLPEGVDDELTTSHLFRASVGAEALVTARIGVSLGYDFGGAADEGKPGPAGGIFGAGLSYIF
jgi:hypothetical protein